MKKYFIILTAFMLCLILPAQIPAAELGISYGEDTSWSPSWCSKGVETHEFELELKTSIEDMNWLYAGIVVNRVWSDVNPGHVIDGMYFSGKTVNFIVALRLTARGTLYKNVFVEGYGSLGWMFPNEHPEIGSNPDVCNLAAVGNFGGNIGYDFGSFAVVYGVGHWSNYLTGGDKGHNRHYIGIRIPFGKKRRGK